MWWEGRPHGEAGESEALTEWRKAEAKYREVIDPYLARDSKKVIDEARQSEISKARAKAGRRLDACLTDSWTDLRAHRRVGASARSCCPSRHGRPKSYGRNVGWS